MKPLISILVAMVVIFLVGMALFSDRGAGPDPWESVYPSAGYDVTTDDHGVRIVEVREGVMGTRFVIEVCSSDLDTAEAARRAAWLRIFNLERVLSTWIEESELTHINRTAADEMCRLSDDVSRLLGTAQTVWGESSGAFDPTVGPLIALWKPLARLERMPTNDQIEAARSLVGFDRIDSIMEDMDPDPVWIEFTKKGMSLDVGGIGKGYAADEACKAALAACAVACRVNAGGDMAARGVPPHSTKGFAVQIRNPAGKSADALPGSEFHLTDGAVATSGNYERYTEIAGKRYSHIVDPRTGRPVPDAITQVTVVAGDGARADALATALTVLGVEKGLALAESLEGVEALFLVPEGDGYRRIASTGFPGIGR